MKTSTLAVESGRAVARDLWWVASSLPLMKNIPRLPQPSESRQLELQKDLVPTVERLNAMSLQEAMEAVGVEGWRVGHYFEALVAHWLCALPRWRLIAANHPVRQDKQTLGAYDFIVENPEGQIEHWEVAVKFYLRRDDNRLEWSNWVGPNQRDRLDKKVNRMRDHQLVLSRREAGRATLRDLNVGDIQRHVALLKGCLFTEWGTPTTGPKGSTREAAGRWTDEKRLSELGHAFPRSRWVRREKPFWLAPLQGVTLEDHAGQLPLEVRRPEMWSRLKPSSSGNWEEAERWFLVPETWRTGR